FPDRRGLASGLVVMGFGLGAVVFNAIIANVASFDAAAKHAAAAIAERDVALKAGQGFDPARFALAPEDLVAVMNVFVAAGMTIMVLGGMGAMLMQNPPGHAARSVRALGRDSFPPGLVLKTHQFYLLWTMLFVNVTAGIMIISNAIPIYSD